MDDITWGTKGENKPSTDLGAVETTGSGKEVTVDAPGDIDGAYRRALAKIKLDPQDSNEISRSLSKELAEPKNKGTESKNTKGPDYFKSVRTMVLLLWTLSNVSTGLSVSPSYFINLCNITF